MLLLLVWRVRSGGFSQNGALMVLVEVLPRIALCRFWWRFFPGVLWVRFRPPLCCSCGSKRAVLLGCVLLVSSFVSKFSRPCWWTLCVPVARVVCFVLAPGELSQMVV
ncbi:hypothetical protein Taro_010158 [Colocasia esculenta]|uniref:Uncharacterized protein n=1 Tax=Colocasia esculenta TaxID=4460 RepID=A0A843U7J3_COLES|nr:hypothetical protein [Colocasia esculenta]